MKAVLISIVGGVAIAIAVDFVSVVLRSKRGPQ